MKALAVRVNKGEAAVRGEAVSSINRGIVLFVGMERGDDHSALTALAEKVLNLRIFENEEGKLHFSLKDKNYQLLCIPNFTLCANTSKGRRPSFENSMPPEQAQKYYQDFIFILQSQGIDVRRGIFGEHMDIRLDLDGPVNILLEI